MDRDAGMIKTILFDADGVVQTTSEVFFKQLGGLVASAHQDEFMQQVFEAELPCLAGEADFLTELEGILSKWAVSVPAIEVLEYWHLIEPHVGVLGLVQELRRGGYHCCLATNQQQHRAGYMQDSLMYRNYFDEGFYSCELGAAKPSTDYFVRVLSNLETPAEETLFIDDNQNNLDGAAETGLQTLHFDLHQVTEAVATLKSELQAVLVGALP